MITHTHRQFIHAFCTTREVLFAVGVDFLAPNPSTRLRDSDLTTYCLVGERRRNMTIFVFPPEGKVIYSNNISLLVGLTNGVLQDMSER